MAVMKQTRGFTLIELLVTITIVAILAALAAPSFGRLVADNALSTQANSLMADLRFARSEALKRGISVTLCPSTTALDAGATCSGSDWKTGWIAFIDNDADNTRKVVAPAETILRRQEGFTTGASIVSNTGTAVSSLRFNSEGRVPGGASGLNFTALNNAATNRLLCISLTGRARTEKGTTTC